VPEKFLAFSSPTGDSDVDNGKLAPEDYLPIFRTLAVECIIRLNKPCYHASRFRTNGIDLVDLVFVDGTCPSTEYIERFIEVAEQYSALAVHCKAGLGRTCTLIGCYLLKHTSLTAAEFIAWARMCRPGSVLGPQQEFLQQIEPICKSWGSSHPNDTKALNPFLIKADRGQGARLIKSKLTRN
jgi:cell division cycle 14